MGHSSEGTEHSMLVDPPEPAAGKGNLGIKGFPETSYDSEG